MRKTVIVAGQRVGRLLVEEIVQPRRGYEKAVCLCDCGTRKEIVAISLEREKPTLSCGCLWGDVVKGNAWNVTHGHTAGGRTSRTYSTWASMLTRCGNFRRRDYPRYGGRGIVVCDRWDPAKGGSFENFLADMGERPEGLSIDRIDTNGNYEPGNCRWATAAQQSKNRRSWRRRAPASPAA